MDPLILNHQRRETLQDQVQWLWPTLTQHLGIVRWICFCLVGPWPRHLEGAPQHFQRQGEFGTQVSLLAAWCDQPVLPVKLFGGWTQQATSTMFKRKTNQPCFVLSSHSSSISDESLLSVEFFKPRNIGLMKLSKLGWLNSECFHTKVLFTEWTNMSHTKVKPKQTRCPNFPVSWGMAATDVRRVFGGGFPATEE